MAALNEWLPQLVASGCPNTSLEAGGERMHLGPYAKSRDLIDE